MEREHRGPTGTDGRAFMSRADGARRVLDDGEVERATESTDRLDVGRDAGLVDDDHGTRPIGDHFADGGGRHVARREVDVGEDRGGARVHHRIGGGDERQRRNDDLVTRPDSGEHERQVQPGRATRNSNALGGARRSRRTRTRTPPRGGPWATHPLRSTSVTALTSASPSTGRMIGIGAVPISSTSIERNRRSEPIEAEPIDEGLSISVMPPPPSNARAATTPRVRPDLRRARPPPGTRDPVRRPGCRPTGGAPD